MSKGRSRLDSLTTSKDASDVLLFDAYLRITDTVLYKHITQKYFNNNNSSSIQTILCNKDSQSYVTNENQTNTSINDDVVIGWIVKYETLNSIISHDFIKGLVNVSTVSFMDFDIYTYPATSVGEQVNIHIDCYIWGKPTRANGNTQVYYDKNNGRLVLQSDQQLNLKNSPQQRTQKNTPNSNIECSSDIILSDYTTVHFESIARNTLPVLNVLPISYEPIINVSPRNSSKTETGTKNKKPNVPTDLTAENTSKSDDGSYILELISKCMNECIPHKKYQIVSNLDYFTEMGDTPMFNVSVKLDSEIRINFKLFTKLYNIIINHRHPNSCFTITRDKTGEYGLVININIIKKNAYCYGSYNGTISYKYSITQDKKEYISESKMVIDTESEKEITDVKEKQQDSGYFRRFIGRALSFGRSSSSNSSNILETTTTTTTTTNPKSATGVKVSDVKLNTSTKRQLEDANERPKQKQKVSNDEQYSNDD